MILFDGQLAPPIPSPVQTLLIPAEVVFISIYNNTGYNLYYTLSQNQNNALKDEMLPLRGLLEGIPIPKTPNLAKGSRNQMFFYYVYAFPLGVSGAVAPAQLTIKGYNEKEWQDHFAFTPSGGSVSSATATLAIQ